MNIMVYTMGKCASDSIFYTLSKDYLTYYDYICKPHTLNPARINDFNFSSPDVNKGYIECVNNFGKDNFKTISSFREPMGYIVSWFFQDLHKWCKKRKMKDSKYLISYFLNQIDRKLTHNVFKGYKFDFYFNESLNFYDLEVKRFLGIDVYSKPFNNGDGYYIFNDNFLLLKYEKINDCISKAISNFLGYEHFELKNYNITKNKVGRVYDQFLKNIRIPSEFLDILYSSKYVKHFYSETEIEGFYHRWSN